MKVYVSKGQQKWIVRIVQDNESRVYHVSSTLSEAEAMAATLRRDIGRHGDDVIDFTDFPIIVKQRFQRSGKTYWVL